MSNKRRTRMQSQLSSDVKRQERARLRKIGCTCHPEIRTRTHAGPDALRARGLGLVTDWLFKHDPSCPLHPPEGTIVEAEPRAMITTEGLDDLLDSLRSFAADEGCTCFPAIDLAVGGGAVVMRHEPRCANPEAARDLVEHMAWVPDDGPDASAN